MPNYKVKALPQYPVEEAMPFPPYDFSGVTQMAYQDAFMMRRQIRGENLTDAFVSPLKVIRH